VCEVILELGRQVCIHGATENFCNVFEIESCTEVRMTCGRRILWQSHGMEVDVAEVLQGWKTDVVELQWGCKRNEFY